MHDFAVASDWQQTRDGGEKIQAGGSVQLGRRGNTCKVAKHVNKQPHGAETQAVHHQHQRPLASVYLLVLLGFNYYEG